MNNLFQIIIPTVNVGLIDDLLRSIATNTLLPVRVIIINNSNCDIKNLYGLPVDLYNNPIPLPVNDSWNLGISKLTNCGFVSILNDDIILQNTFFEQTARSFNRPRCAVICPHTVSTLEKFNNDYKENKIYKMKKREGWAFTIKKDVLDCIPPIHPTLQTFYGDDWFWRHSHHIGFLWYKNHNIIIYHKGGTSVRKLGKEAFRGIRKKEKTAFVQLKIKGLV